MSAISTAIRRSSAPKLTPTRSAARDPEREGARAANIRDHVAFWAGVRVRRVALIERDRVGGDCLWTGCVPSKSLIAAAALAHHMRHADTVGLAPVDPTIDCGRVMSA